MNHPKFLLSINGPACSHCGKSTTRAVYTLGTPEEGCPVFCSEQCAALNTHWKEGDPVGIKFSERPVQTFLRPVLAGVIEHHAKWASEWKASSMRWRAANSVMAKEEAIMDALMSKMNTLIGEI